MKDPAFMCDVCISRMDAQHCVGPWRGEKEAHIGVDASAPNGEARFRFDHARGREIAAAPEGCGFDSSLA